MSTENRRKSWKAFQERNPGYNAKHTKAWRDRNPEKVKSYAKSEAVRRYERGRRFRRYEMTEEKHAEMFAAQSGKCAICETSHDEYAKGLAIDHDHDTGEVRGLLCHRCNTALGLLCDDISIFSRAISYLLRSGTE